ncbi:MAG: tRNA pseudouridine(55) synthase TruB [Pirellulales bacterium]
MFGLLNVHKPAGPTSRDVVNRVQRLVRPAKVGHAGTLDPLATGVLVVCLGPATRLVEYVQQMPKRYRGAFLLGRHSPTEDVDSEITLLADPPVPTRAELQVAARRLTGTIQQRPPAYSALKVAGRRAYQLARAGHEVELQARVITIHRLEILHYDYPQLELDIECSSGTYVRSLGRDLAELVGSAAVMAALERQAVGPFSVAQAIPLEELSAASIGAALLDPARAVTGLPRRELSAAELFCVQRGQALPHEPLGPAEYAAFTPDGSLAAVLERRDRGYLPAANFVAL